MAVIATSGTATFNQTAIDLISFAYFAAQIIGEEETPSGFQLATGLDALNVLVKGWQATGIHVWTQEEAILFPQPSQFEYAIGVTSTDHATVAETLIQTTLSGTVTANTTAIPLTSAAGIVIGDTFGVQLDAGTNFWTTVNNVVGNTVTIPAPGITGQASAGAIVFDYPLPLARPLKVPQATRLIYSSAIQIPLYRMARLEYQSLPNPQNTGTTTSFFFDPQQGLGTASYSSPLARMSLWPSPVDFTSGIRFTAQRPLQDFNTLAQAPDFPAEWLAAIRWNLALDRATTYGAPPEVIAGVEKQAQAWFGLVTAWDREPEGVRFGVSFSPMGRSSP